MKLDRAGGRVGVTVINLRYQAVSLLGGFACPWERELETGRLVLPFGSEGPRLLCHKLLFLRSKAHLPKIKAFREWLFEQLVLCEAPR